MFIGALKGIFLTLGFNIQWQGYTLMLGVFFGLLQLFFQLSPRQKGLSLGANLMFLGSLAAMLAGSMTEGVGVLLVMAIAIPMILFWQKLTASFLKIFFDKTDLATPRVLPQPKPVVSLPPEQSQAVDTNRVRQQASPEQASIIEGTTKTLDAERASSLS